MGSGRSRAANGDWQPPVDAKGPQARPKASFEAPALTCSHRSTPKGPSRTAYGSFEVPL